MTKKRNFRFEIRLSEEEYAMFKKKSAKYQTMSGMIRDAVKGFNDIKTQGQIEVLTEIKSHYTKFYQRLGWLGGNINQAQHRANELAVAGKLSPAYIQKVLIPKISEAINLIREIKSEQDKIYYLLEASWPMIITILPNSSGFHAVAYNENKVSHGMAELMVVENFPTLTPANYSTENFRRYLEDYSSKNAYIQNAQFHVAVSCKGTEYTHQQLLEIAHRYLEEMGYAEDGQPLLAYAHNDTPNNHIHIITSRIAPDGHKINHDHEKRRSRKVTQKIMQEYTGEKQEPTVNEVAVQALGYRFTTKAQFCAILESQGYECKDDESKPVVHITEVPQSVCQQGRACSGNEKEVWYQSCVPRQERYSLWLLCC